MHKIKILRTVNEEEINGVFTDMGNVADWGEYFISKLEVDGKEYFSKILAKDLTAKRRFAEDFVNFEKQGFKILI